MNPLCPSQITDNEDKELQSASSSADGGMIGGGVAIIIAGGLMMACLREEHNKWGFAFLIGGICLLAAGVSK